MPEVALGNVPARDAIEHIKQKLKVPSRRWTDFMGEVNAKVFHIAGATKLDMVADFQEAIVKVAEQGLTIEDFRKDFDAIVENYGWSYKGSRGWRTSTIFNTNLRTAHAAGRWKQIQRVKKARPWLVYATVGDGRVRDQHQRWHYIALPVDDPWWDTHYPPNGWGCRCGVISATEAQLKRMGIEPLTKAPDIVRTDRVNTRTGEYLGEVPEGIDPGWDYNVGKAWLGPEIAYGERLAELNAGLLTAVIPPPDKYISALTRSWQAWLKAGANQPPRGYAHSVGFLPQSLMTRLKNEGSAPANSLIVIFDNQTSHLQGGHKKAGSRFPEAWLADLPKRLNDYQAILKHRDEYIFVLKGATGDKKRGRVVVAVNFKRKGKTFNSVRSLGVMDTRHFKQKSDYELIEGELE